MLSERDTVMMLREWAAKFDMHYQNGEYGMASRIYEKAQTIVDSMEMGEAVLKELFGDWDSDDGTGCAEDNGLFKSSRVRKVNWECCIKRHQTYQDVACRQFGLPLKYYSDKDYCAKCDRTKKERTR